MNNRWYNYKLLIAYDGTNYSGWQVQANASSIQSTLQTVLQTILRKEVVLIGSGRTDTGVHAMGQVAHFKFDSPLDLYRVHGSMNGLLPRDIRVKHIQEVPLNFHAQYSASGKIYHYHISTERYQDPFRRLYAYHHPYKIDLSLLEDAARRLIGTHDFTSFANEAHAGSASRDPVRTLKRIDLNEQEGGFRLEFEADGFLYKMVRNITGTLLEVAEGKRRPEEITSILEARDRRSAGRAVPPHGLFLIEVHYQTCL